MIKIFLPILIFVLSFSTVFAQVNITFEVNTVAMSSVDAEGIFLAGGTDFGVPGDNPMTDLDGDGIYTITVQRDQGVAGNYTFLNGNCPGWGCKENLGGLPCADATNYNDRILSPVMSDTTILACFGTCDNDGLCTIIADSIELTFELNTENITVDPSGIFIAGGGNFGNPGDYPMIDPDGDGIYTITVTKALGFNSYYTFTNGNCGDYSCKEDLDGLPCGDPTAFNDRFLSATMSDSTVLACFGSCVNDGTCIETSVNGLRIDENLFTLRPTLVNDFTNITFGENAISQKSQIVVMNAVGQIVHTADVQNESNYLVNTTQYSSGIYFLSIRTEKAMLTKKFVVQK